MRLHEYTTPNAVPHYSCAISPGKHCPLFGVAAVLRHVAGAALLYIGTQDCVYYAQKDALTRQLSVPGGKRKQFRTLAIQLSDADIIFGIRPRLESLLEQEAVRPDTGAVFLVTSCSIEVLSEDLQGVVDAVRRRTGKRITLIQTENFKAFSYIQGVEDAILALTAELEPLPVKEKTFTILGARQRGAENCEPARYLVEQGYALHSILPYDIDMQRVERLSEVSLTLVVDASGLGAAQRLHDAFGIPFVRFDQRLNLKQIAASWRFLSQLTGQDLEDWVREQLAETETLAEQVRARVAGKTFFYGQKVLYPFEGCLFLSDLGMIPSCIFLGSTLDRFDDARLALSARVDPLLWQNADQAAVRAMLEADPPDYAVGIPDSAVSSYSIPSLQFDIALDRMGFSYYRHCLRQILEEAERRTAV